jgi:hypothetical protein
MRNQTHKILLLLATAWTLSEQRSYAPNLPPKVSISWPHAYPQPVYTFNESFNAGTLIKIKAEAEDTDGSIAQIEFYADTDLIGVATNSPFNAVWEVKQRPFTIFGFWNLKAVAIDNLGIKTESVPITIHYATTQPTVTVLPITAPANGAVFPSPATFVFSAELLASNGENGPIEFFIDSNSVGLVNPGGLLTATTPPASVTVKDLEEGEHKLTVRYPNFPAYCTCNGTTNTIRVVKLGLRLPMRTADGYLQFEGVTSFPGRQTTIQTSANLQDWLPLTTIEPTANTFTFTAPTPATDSNLFYRLVLPSQ